MSLIEKMNDSLELYEYGKKLESENKRLRILCQNTYDRLLRGQDDSTLLEMLSESWKLDPFKSEEKIKEGEIVLICDDLTQ
jgi:hypothetical protein